MQKSIADSIKKHKQQPNLKFRLKETAEKFTDTLFYTLFDAETPVDENMEKLAATFEDLVDLACWNVKKPCSKVWENYLAKLPQILELLNLDAKAFVEDDPAALSKEEVYLCYPGFYAIAIYRLAHELYETGFPLVPRLMTEYAHRLTGVDINPGAKIGKSFFIDHATGIVIGETAVIKNHVRIYQGVTLGALYVAKNLKNVKRHPTIENNVTIYANATILGGDTVIGENSVIGGNVWLTKSIPANSVVSHTPDIKIKTVTNE
ncbi:MULTISPECIES: serine O-acetyltransferase EpsC [Galbibacter]|uniref:Serine O-acetyltransferase n=1 Tax=Galbibacter pacificus TaxID=2996052 RepID=A0ABT6FQS7_9FLAO|nr:serine O-acetyltransferase EpsC [Galbibacter pacificus]MDG3581946.1 serine O-acetyltransferase [Galbibacter pacificus]MDG3585580.1 serine O-acetyltransferase [Galbibacter pacificus]